MQFLKSKNNSKTEEMDDKAVFVTHLSFTDGKLHVVLNRNIDSVGFLDKKNKYHAIQNFKNEAEVTLENKEFDEALSQKGYYGRRPIKAQVGNKFFEIVNKEILKKHVSERYFKLEEHAGWTSVYYFSIDGRLKAGVLYSQNFHRSVKTTGAIKTKLINSELKEDGLSIELSFYNKKRMIDLVKKQKILNVLIHDDAIIESSQVSYKIDKTKLKICLTIRQLLNNGWLTIETNDGYVFDSIAIEIDKVYDQSEINIDYEGEVSHIRIGESLKKKLLYRIPVEEDKFHMNIKNDYWKLKTPDFL